MNVEERIAARVTEVDGHHVWQGKVDRNGYPVTKHSSRTTTVRRLVWEIAHGPLAPSVRVKGCPGQPLCVRLDHLEVDTSRAVAARRARTRQGMGSLRQIRPRTWELRVTVGRWDDGRPRTLYRTVTADNETEATALLVTFVEELSSGRQPESRDLRDMTGTWYPRDGGAGAGKLVVQLSGLIMNQVAVAAGLRGRLRSPHSGLMPTTHGRPF